MAYISLAVAILGPLAVYFLAMRRFETFETAPLRHPEPAPDLSPIQQTLEAHRAAFAETRDRLEKLEEDVRDQTLAIAEGIERVDRAERRVRAAVGRARKRMEELGYVDEGLEAEASQLRELDGDGGPDEGMHAVPADVDRAQEELRQVLSSLPGDWS